MDCAWLFHLVDLDVLIKYISFKERFKFEYLVALVICGKGAKCFSIQSTFTLRLVIREFMCVKILLIWHPPSILVRIRFVATGVGNTNFYVWHVHLSTRKDEGKMEGRSSYPLPASYLKYDINDTRILPLFF